MRYLDFLREVHGRLAPRTYLEIGVRNGNSLALAKCRSVGIDPAYSITAELGQQAKLFRTTSDEYFVDTQPLAALGGKRVDMAFIDGMHLFEYALRDFDYVEHAARWSSVIVFDDVMPRNSEEANRDRKTTSWTGDVFKVWLTLRTLRPDLVLIPVDTQPTGLLLVLGLEPESLVLGDQYDALVDQYVVEDPQSVPEDIFKRVGALQPEELLKAPFWRVLRTVRAARLPRAQGLPLVLRSLHRSFPQLELPGGNGGVSRPAGTPDQ